MTAAEPHLLERSLEDIDERDLDGPHPVERTRFERGVGDLLEVAAGDDASPAVVAFPVRDERNHPIDERLLSAALRDREPVVERSLVGVVPVGDGDRNRGFVCSRREGDDADPAPTEEGAHLVGAHPEPA